jgi:hypothetical protein
MRYAYESYKFRGQEFFRIIDTFNGGKIVEKGIAYDSHAIGRRDELNALHVERAHKVEISTAAFKRAHGKNPRGNGSWGFCPRQNYNCESLDYLDHVQWFNGDFSEARRKALAFFRTKPGVSVVVVCS